MFNPDTYYYLIRNIARNPNTSEDTLKKIVNKIDDPYIRCHIAQNQSILPETLDILSSDDDMFVKRHVARNPNTSKEALFRLAMTGDQEIIEAIKSRNR